MIAYGPLDDVAQGLRRLHWDAHVRGVQRRLMRGRKTRRWWLLGEKPDDPTHPLLQRVKP